MTSFLALFAALNRKKVQYLVAGGWAVNLYGIERATGDLDLVVYLEKHNLEKVVAVMKGSVVEELLPGAREARHIMAAHQSGERLVPVDGEALELFQELALQ